VKAANWQTAAMALACGELLVTPETRMGGQGQAPTPTKENPVLPAAVAAVRMAAQHGGRDELIARGLVERDLVLALEDDPDSGQPQVVLVDEGGDRKRGKGSRGATALKPRGELLALTADEATKLGIATAAIDAFPSANAPPTLDAVADALGIDAWHEAGSAARAMSRASVSPERARYMKDQADRLAKIDRRSRELEEDVERMLSAHASADDARRSTNGAGARRKIDNNDAKRQVRLSKARAELRVLREEKQKILRAAPK
jgi:hypothetical protein